MWERLYSERIRDEWICLDWFCRDLRDIRREYGKLSAVIVSDGGLRQLKQIALMSRMSICCCCGFACSSQG